MRTINRLLGGVLLLLVALQTSANYIFSVPALLDLQHVPTLANGNLAFIAYSDTIHLSGLYNGAAGASHRARIPNYGRVQFEYCGVSTLPDPQCQYTMNVHEGVFRTTATLRNNSLSVELVTFPHRIYERTIVNDLTVNRLTTEPNAFLVRLLASPGQNSDDLNITRQYAGSVQGVNYIVYELETKHNENSIDLSASNSKVFVIDQDVPEAVTLPVGQSGLKVQWLTTIGEDFVSAMAEFTEVVAKRQELVATHLKEWARFWTSSGITVTGNDELAKVVHSSLYALASSLPAVSPFSRDADRVFGLSPAGLGDDFYQGHTTSDSEMWLLPSVLLLEPKWSEHLLQYRFSKLEAGLNLAKNSGYSGLLFPERSAASGIELSSNPELVHRISGDVAFAVKQHLFATLDHEWFQRVGCDLSLLTAEFWQHRAQLNPQIWRHEIINGRGANTMHVNKDNHAYTNVVAAFNLYFAEFAACYCPYHNVPKKGSLFNQARSIRLQYDFESDYTPAYDGYTPNIATKEADTVLISYPLRYPLNKTTAQNNLRIYENNLAGDNVPSPTFAVHNIVRLGLGQEPTEAQFEASYKPFVRSDFKLWSQVIDGRLVVRNYVSGAAGFVQQLINGYAGIRLLDDGLVIEAAALPPKTTGLILNGIKYLNGTYAIQVTETSVILRIVDRDVNTEFLVNGSPQEAVNGQFTIPRQTGSIRLRARETSFGNCKYVVSTISQLYPKPNNYILNATNTVEVDNLPTLANGNLAFIAYSDTVHLSGAFSGVVSNTTLVRIPNYARVQFEYCGPFSVGASRCAFEFDLRRGLIRTQSNYKSDSFSVELLTFPHRIYAGTVVNQLKVNRLTTDRAAFLVRLFASPGSNSADLNITLEQSNTVDNTNYVRYVLTPVSKENLQAPGKTISVFAEKIPEAVTLQEGVNELIVNWVTTFSDNVESGTAEFREVVQKKNDLLQLHVAEWTSFWDASGITVEGSDGLAQTIHSSLYALASALPSTANLGTSSNGLSPAGISADHYNGKTSWDSEIWLQPPALLLEPKWSQHLLQYRFERQQAAANHATLNEYAGLFFPYQSAVTGNEVSENFEEALLKQHVSGDVSFAVKQHLFATLDTEWFKQVGCSLAVETGKFWESRTVFNNVTERFDIKGITGPDASHKNKENNAYVNVLAAYNLFFAEFSACYCNGSAAQEEKLYKLARSIQLPYNNEGDYTPAFDGFESATRTREAETILLSYPLDYPLNQTTQRNNLRVYAGNVQATQVPSTTYSVQNIVRLGLGEIPTLNQFERSYVPYVRSDFKLWTQSADARVVVRNHVAGAAGFLQQILNGYAGIRLLDDGLVIRNVTLPPGTTKLSLNGIRYLDGAYSVEVTFYQIKVKILNPSNTVNIYVNGEIISDQLREITITRSGGSVRIAPRNQPFGQCKYVKSTIGHRSSATLLAGSICLLVLSALTVFTTL